MPTVFRIILYPLTGLVFFFIFFFILFPFDSIKSRVEAQVEQGLGGQYEVTIGELSPAFLTGIELDAIEIRSRGPAAEGLAARLDNAIFRFQLLPLLWGNKKVKFVIASKGGELAGRLAAVDDLVQVRAELENFDLSKWPLLVEPLGLKLTSQVDAEVDMELYPRAPLRNNGSLKLAIAELKMDRSSLQGLFTLPAMELASKGSKSKLDIVMHRGTIEIRELTLKGNDVDLTMSGKIYLAQRLENYRFNLRGKLGFSDAAGKELPFLVIVEKERGADGLYPVTITGQVRRPNIRVGNFKVPL